MRLIERAQLVGAEILGATRNQHLKDILLTVTFCKLLDIIAHLKSFQRIDEMLMNPDIVALFHAGIISSETMTSEESLGANMKKVILRALIAVTVGLDHLLPELLVVVECLCENGLVVLNAVAVVTEGELGQHGQFLKVLFGKRLYIIKTPKTLKMYVLVARHIDDLNILACFVFLVHSGVDVGKQLFLATFQRVGKEVVNTLVTVVTDGVANVYS